MGLFDWFKGSTSNVVISGDAVWLTKRAKFAGISAQIAGKLDGGDSPMGVILVAHFQDCLTELQNIIEASGYANGSVLAITQDSLTKATTSLGLDESQALDIIVGERHFLPSHDEAIIEFTRSLPCQCHIVHHVSLEDPLMKLFSGEWVEAILKQLGMKEHEVIESDLIRRRIRAAQQRIQSRCTSDLPADTAEDWINKHYRP